MGYYYTKRVMASISLVGKSEKGEEVDVFAVEVQANLNELKDFVREIALVGQGVDRVTYRVALLEQESPEIKVEFVRGRGYFIEGTKEHYENFQALLSTKSRLYRQRFAEHVSKRLTERMMMKTG